MSDQAMQYGPGLGDWFERATAGLARGSARQVREEIQSHYEQAYEDAVASGYECEAAARSALKSLGDAAAANRAYKKVLPTTWESRLLCEDRWLSGVAHAGRRYVLLFALAVLSAGLIVFALNPTFRTAEILFIGAGISLLILAALYLPVYSPSGGRVFRAFKWAWVISLLWLAHGPNNGDGSWIELLSVGLPVFGLLAFIEWSRSRLRRKLPVDQWSPGLYL